MDTPVQTSFSVFISLLADTRAEWAAELFLVCQHYEWKVEGEQEL